MLDPSYFKRHARRKPREQLVRSVSLCEKKDYALDLGAGNLIESRFLLNKGFRKVIAVDKATQVRDFASRSRNNRFTFRSTTFEKYNFPVEKFDIVNAQYSLPFFGPERFGSFIRKIIRSLKPGGIFVGQLFGVRDSWKKTRPDVAFQTRTQALDFFKNTDILEFIEEDRNGKTIVGGPKHWHIFHFIVRKKK